MTSSLSEQGATPDPFQREYQTYLLQRIEDYKWILTRPELMELGTEAATELQSASEGKYFLTEVVMQEAVDRIIIRRLRLPSFTEWRATHGLATTATATILGPSGRPASAQETTVILHAGSLVSDELIHRLSRYPDDLFRLTPRRFEELVAELLARQGYAVELTPQSRDGGKDIVAQLRGDVGSFVLYVECKRYGPAQRVGVKPVRELLGVMQADRVTGAMLVTTASFTAGAYAIADSEPHRIALRDYHRVRDWLVATQK